LGAIHSRRRWLVTRRVGRLLGQGFHAPTKSEIEVACFQVGFQSEGRTFGRKKELMEIPKSPLVTKVLKSSPSENSRESPPNPKSHKSPFSILFIRL